jgi:hypothetical protein
MNVEQLAKNAIEKIKSNWGLPKRGFIAGGSIANIIWEEVSGTKAIINDIDVFLFDGLLENYNEDKKEYYFSFKEDEQNVWYDDYAGLRFIDRAKNYYSICESTTDGIFNYVSYKSNTHNPEIIIKSFDINCTAVGYSIEEDKFYWTPEFEKFLKTGELKISNLKTPCHTAIRIVKKSEELDVKLDLFELEIVQGVLSRQLQDVYKVRFQDRYFNLFNNHKILENYFTIEKDLDCMTHVKTTYDKDVNLWTLKTKKESVWSGDNNLLAIHKGEDFLFYLRNIYTKPELIDVWNKLRPLFINEDYVDGGVDVEDMKLLSSTIQFLPKTILNLRGYKLTEQVSIVKSLLERYKEDPAIAFSVLEKHTIEPNQEIDDSTALLYELSVRKEIVDERHNSMVESILSKVEYNDSDACYATCVD